MGAFVSQKSHHTRSLKRLFPLISGLVWFGMLPMTVLAGGDVLFRDGFEVQSTGVQLVAESGHGIPGFYLGQVGVADFDQDGDPDVAINAYFEPQPNPDASVELRLYENISTPGGAIVFQERRFPCGTLGEPCAPDEAFAPGPDRFTLSDLNNPTYPQGHPVEGFNNGALVIGDFDGDLVADIGYEFGGARDFYPDAGTGIPGNGLTNYAGVLLNRISMAGWHVEQTMPTDGVVAGVGIGMAAADVDGDSREELIFINDATTAAVSGGLWYDYDATLDQWTAQQRSDDVDGFSHGISYGGAIAVGDLNGDDLVDVAIGGNSNRLLGNQDCTSNLQYGHVFAGRALVTPGFDTDPLFAIRSEMDDAFDCYGSDNAAYAIADMDGDTINDIVVAGSAPGLTAGYSERFDPGNTTGLFVHYSLGVLFNSGTGDAYTTWLAPLPNGTTGGNTNTAPGNEDLTNIAIGDINSDGLPDLFVQGHYRNYAGRTGPFDDPFDNNDGNPGTNAEAFYIFVSQLWINNGDRTFTQLSGFEAGLGEAFPFIGEGGQILADFNSDGRDDLLVGGALDPWHSNGANGADTNTLATIVTYVYRSEEP